MGGLSRDWLLARGFRLRGRRGSRLGWLGRGSGLGFFDSWFWLSGSRLLKSWLRLRLRLRLGRWLGFGRWFRLRQNTLLEDLHVVDLPEGLLKGLGVVFDKLFAGRGLGGADWVRSPLGDGPTAAERSVEDLKPVSTRPVCIDMSRRYIQSAAP